MLLSGKYWTGFSVGRYGMSKVYQLLGCVGLLMMSLGCTAEQEAEAPVKTPVKAAIVAGKHYTKVDENKGAVGPLEEVKVVEFFSYGCPHCAHLEPGLNQWLKDLPTYVSFEHTPAFWNDSFERLARTYYALTLLKKEHEMRAPLFGALHKQKKVFPTDESIIDFFDKQGVDRDKFSKMLNSFAVKQKLKMAGNAFKAHNLRSVPTFVVAGQYVTSVADAGSEAQLWQTLNYLTSRVKSGEL